MLLLKASLLLSAALVAARLLRRAPAGVRHRLWSATFAALLALPLLAFALPAVYVPLPHGWSGVPAGSVPRPWQEPASSSRTPAEDRAHDPGRLAGELPNRSLPPSLA